MRASFEPQGIVVELIVAGQGDQGAPTGTQREEDLHCRVCPHLHHKEQEVLKRIFAKETILSTCTSVRRSSLGVT